MKKKNKAKDASDTISHQSDDGLTDYVDTASVTVSGSASNFEQEAVYDDTDAQDVYDDVDRSNEGNSENILIQSRQLIYRYWKYVRMML